MSVPVCVVCVCVGWGEIVRNGNGEGNTCFLNRTRRYIVIFLVKYESNFWIKKKTEKQFTIYEFYTITRTCQIRVE